MKNDGGPAFPHSFEDTTGHPRFFQSQGMTLRDYFAAAALQGMFAADSADSVIPLDRKVPLAYTAADEMLKEREKC